MNTLSFLKLYALTIPIFFAIDMIWLALIAKNFYREHLGYIMAPSVNWPPAIVFYLIFIAGLVYFVIYPAIGDGSFSTALVRGIFFGLVTYATYDLTNFATVRDWPLIVVIADLAWGMVLSGAVSAASYLAATRTGLV